MFTKTHIIGFILVAIIGFVGGQVVFADYSEKKIDRHIQDNKITLMNVSDTLCGWKKLELEEAKFTEATPENVRLYNLLQSNEGCYYWVYDSVMKGELGKAQ